MAANYHNATNLRVIVDRNRIQNDDFMDVQMEIGDIGEKFRSFGWTVKEVDGHDMSSLVDVVDWANSEDGGPVAIVANTIKGKGVSYMENNPSFHGMARMMKSCELHWRSYHECAFIWRGIQRWIWEGSSTNCTRPSCGRVRG